MMNKSVIELKCRDADAFRRLLAIMDAEGYTVESTELVRGEWMGVFVKGEKHETEKT